MRKIIITLMALFLANAGMAQVGEHENLKEAETTAAGKISFGVKAGYASFTLAGAGVTELSRGGKPVALGGYTAGVEVVTKLNTHFWLKHGASIVQKGAGLMLADEGQAAFRSKYRNTYLEIMPLTPAFQWKGLQLFAGPYAGMLINSSIERKNGESKLYLDRSIYGDGTQEGNYTQKFDAGIVAGAEYGLNSGWNLGFKYAYGVTPLIEDTEKTAGQWKLFNRGFSITLGYTIFGK